MSELAAAGNVLAPAYHVLQEKGYQVSFDKEHDWWVARKAGIQLIGYSTLELCGLAYMHEAKGQEWRVTDEQIEAYMQLAP
ncbi:hypothetical protein KBK19_15950 [Microvirga sp. STR05]|uniref:Uncharacterized protein n=2 Tax=Hymenobacter TaxID=89966 RepID=A0A7G7WAN8_9BACT|nr:MULTISPECIES: hypothetical protein [Hymenobacter]MBD2716536.1 hypothetical protein [Hymenobacter duratus]MBR7951451.1 hypothetical protein [Microvirga sp. STR05]QNH63431.1 hypothetical protein H4317_06435 [Hymenobacter sediminicola]